MERKRSGRYAEQLFCESLLRIQSPVVGIGLQAQVLLKAGGRRTLP